MAWSRVRGHPDRAEVHILMMGRTITGIAAFSQRTRTHGLPGTDHRRRRPARLVTLNQLAQAVRYTTSGKREGADAFPGKRPPSFTGS
jgi:hypothetical protein